MYFYRYNNTVQKINVYSGIGNETIKKDSKSSITLVKSILWLQKQ